MRRDERVSTTSLKEATPPTLLVALAPEVKHSVLSQGSWEALCALGNVVETHGLAWADVDLPETTRVLITGWETPQVTSDVLDRLPALELVMHSAGSVRYLLPPDTWDRGIRVATAAASNNQFVAEYTAAQIMLSLKGVHKVVAHGRTHRAYPPVRVGPGTRRQRVGLVSFGSIARGVREALRRLDAEVWAWDPYVPDHELEAVGVHPAKDLATLFDSCVVISVHTPLIPGVTEGLVSGGLLSRLRDGATFINTARGAVVDEPALVELLQRRQDLTAILDVTWPEPPDPESPLWSLPNVWLTGHVAGALGTERLALGGTVAAEMARFIRGEALQYEVSGAVETLRA